MKRKSCFPILLLVALAVLSTSAIAQERVDPEIITVVGESPIYEGNVAQAKERALQEAFSAAISQVMGSYITAESYSQNFVSIDRSVLSKTRGYVKTYDVLQATQQPDNLSLQVKVVVSKESIKDDLTALGILLESMGNPVVQIQAQDEGLDAPESGPCLKRFLSAKGFYVLDQVEDRQPDVVITLTGKINNQNAFGETGFSGAVVGLEAKATQQSTKKVIASKDIVANGAGLNETAAKKEAYRKAAEDVAPQLVEAISEKWGQELTAGRSVQLIVKVSEYAKVQQFSKELEHVFGVKKVDLKTFQNNEAQYLVCFAGQTKTLVDLLTRIPADKCPVSVQRFDANVVELTAYYH
jgi:hypothetical protein